METITEAREAWLQIKNETQKNANTAQRVGDAGLSLADAVEAISEQMDSFAETKLDKLPELGSYIDENVFVAAIIDNGNYQDVIFLNKTHGGSTSNGASIDYGNNNYDVWRIPSIGELRAVISNYKDGIVEIPNFSTGLYWTNEERSAEYANAIQSNNNSVVVLNKVSDVAYHRNVFVKRYEGIIIHTDSTLKGTGTISDPLGISDVQKTAIKTKTLYLTKNGLNSDFSISVFSYPKKIKITNVVCMSNCENLSVSVGTETYNKTTLVNLEIPANTEISVNDINILAGNNCGNVRLTFIEI